MTLLEELKNKIESARKSNSKVSVRQICIRANIPESTYFRAMNRGSCTMSVYEAIKEAFEKISK